MSDIIKLNPSSFNTIYLRGENGAILRTELGKKIAISQIVPEEWKPFRIYDSEFTLNENKRNILLVDRKYLSQIEREFKQKIKE